MITTLTLSAAARTFALVLGGYAALALPLSQARAQSPFNSTMPPTAGPQYGSRGLMAQPPPAARASEVPRAGVVAPDGNPGALGGPTILDNVGVDYRLRRGDQLTYQVKEDRDPPTTLQVTDSGELIPTYLGHGIPVVGKTVGEVQAEVKEALEHDLYYHATVEIALLRVAPPGSKGRVYMTGAIHMKGPIDIPTDETLTVSRAILRAGGPTDFADMHKVRLIRKGGPRGGIIVDAQAVLDGKSDNDPELKPDDTVRLVEKWINIHM